MSVTKTGLVHSVICFPSEEKDIQNKTMFERAEIVATVPTRWPLHPAYMHTFGKKVFFD